MKKITLHNDSLDIELISLLGPKGAELNSRFLSASTGPMAPNAEILFNIGSPCFLSLKARERLILISWYLGDVGFLLREQLRERILKQPIQEQLALLPLMESKNCCLNRFSYRYSARDFYGNIKDQIFETAKFLKLRVRNQRRSQRKVRRRGYSDHGTHREASRWLPTSGPELDELQSYIESERDLVQDTLEIVKGFYE